MFPKNMSLKSNLTLPNTILKSLEYYLLKKLFNIINISTKTFVKHANLKKLMRVSSLNLQYFLSHADSFGFNWF